MTPFHWRKGVRNDIDRLGYQLRAYRIICPKSCVVPLSSPMPRFSILGRPMAGRIMEQMHPPPTRPITNQFQNPIPCHQDHEVLCHQKKKRTGDDFSARARDCCGVRENDDGNKMRKRKHTSKHSTDVVMSIDPPIKETWFKQEDRILLREPPRRKLLCRPHPSSPERTVENDGRAAAAEEDPPAADEEAGVPPQDLQEDDPPHHFQQPIDPLLDDQVVHPSSCDDRLSECTTSATSTSTSTTAPHDP